MKIPRDVSGGGLADVLCRKWQYSKVHQVGNHIIVETAQPSHHRIAIPDHHRLRLGTLSSILRAVWGSDDEVVVTAWRSEDRVLVILDLDFANIRAYPPGVHSGIIRWQPNTLSAGKLADAMPGYRS